MPPLQWSMERISELHPGSDGIVRVVTVKTTTGEYKRCIKRLFPLPVERTNDMRDITINL